MPAPRRNSETALPRFRDAIDRPGREAITGIELTAIALSAVWLGGAGLFLVLSPSEASFDGVRTLMTLLTLALPVGMIWVAATAMRSNRAMREESARLQTALDSMSRAYGAQSRQTTREPDRTVARKPDHSARPTETASVAFSSSRGTPRPSTAARAPLAPRETGMDQRSLPLETPPEALNPPLGKDDFIRALNFPETAEDMDGFAALRRALRDRTSAQLIQASQDVLTLLSQDGIYMDDLPPDRARPEIWRQFAQGTRGRVIAPLGGIRDRASLALTAGRMKQDPIFRDAAHHFLRLFDRTFAGFEPNASDAEISAFSDTRTARAFMLLGRVAGTFD